jgi:kumamolisin
MTKHHWRRAVVLVAAAAASAAAIASVQASSSSTSRANARPVVADTPVPVADGSAQLRGRHNGSTVLRINVGVAVRDSDGLDALIQAAGTPGNPQYGHYLTQAQYMDRYAPTDAAAAAVSDWLTSQGLDVTGVSPDNLLVHAEGTVRQLDQAFGVQINDYRSRGRAFHANDRNPTYPAGLDISWVSGLSNFDHFVISPSVTSGGLDSGDFRTAYNVTPTGTGLTMGFTLWGEALPQSDYDGYAAATGQTKQVIGQAGDDGLDFITIDGATNESDTDGEVALDTQAAHAMAPGIHETYWLAHDNGNGAIEDTENAAANSSVKIISSSFSCEGCGVDGNMDAQFQHGASVGKTFIFSTGDKGASVGRSSEADSQYVLAVGGTNLTLDGSSNWSSETAWSGSGGGCDNGISRPSWQTGITGAQTWGGPPTPCSGRAEPDVAADSSTCAFVFVDGGSGCFIGTSLSAPLWGAMETLWNGHNNANGRPGIGFSPPLIYALANDPTTYPLDFHDITSGNNGFAAGTGWDEVTGWGSPIFDKLSNNVADVTYTGPTQVSKGDTITLSATLFDHNASTLLATAALGTLQVSLAAAGSNCDANVDNTGHASCSVTINDNPGHYSAIAAYAGDAAYKGGSQTVDFTVLHIPTKIVYSGDTSGDYNDPVTLSGTLSEDITSGSPIAGRTLTFTLGAESCPATTNASGFAHCTVTPLDVPGPFTVHASFAGDEPLYEPTSKDTPFMLKKEESKLVYTGPTTSDYHDVFTAAAELTDPDGGAPIAGKPVTFTLGVGDTCTASTTLAGIASCTITPHQSGTLNLVASFAGDAFYLPSNDTQPFAITPEETTMQYTGPTVILAGSGGATLTATMVEDGANDNDGDPGSSAPDPAETVTLSIGSQTCTGTTDSSGNVSCTIPSVTVPLGPETVGASFAGDAFYKPSSDSTNAIVFAFPSRGAFTLGDITAGGSGTVTWWGDTWWKLNTLTGGAAPSSDKGFAGTITLPTTTPPTGCGSNWTTTGGNSPPPVGGVPSYMGVVVTSSVSKSGSTIGGNSVHIVVVNVDPGYGPDPSQHGTGTIVATFC